MNVSKDYVMSSLAHSSEKQDLNCYKQPPGDPIKSLYGKPRLMSRLVPENCLKTLSGTL